MRVLLHENLICERGTTQAVIDYARALRERGHSVSIAYPRNYPGNVPAQVERMAQEFQLLPYVNHQELLEVEPDVDAAYFIKAGGDDGIHLPNTRSVVHAVFAHYEPHGDFYAYVSDWLARSVRSAVVANPDLAERGKQAMIRGCANALDFATIEHIVDMPVPRLGYRSTLGIPDRAFVIGRYGGYDTFDLPFVQATIVRLLRRNRRFWFVGVNTKPFVDHPRALFPPAILDRQEKADFLAACDVFVTGRGEGETFGLSHAEALQIGIPVLAWRGGRDRNHVEMLEDLGGLYRNHRDLAWRLRLLATGVAHPRSAALRMRGDRYRPASIAPVLERALAGS